MNIVVASSVGAAIRTHGWHTAAAIAFLAAGLIAAAVADSREKRRRGPRPAGGTADARPPAKPRNWAVVVASLAGVGAASVHFDVMPEHFGEALLYGTFFAVTASLQLAWSALVLLRPRRSLLVAGVVANAAVVLLWLMTRLVAIPLGPDAGSTEEFGRLDVVASSCELLVVAAGVTALLLSSRRRAAAAPAYVAKVPVGTAP